ncbi:MAG TPA: MaoC/PaaZ C-terminal domain-containing protein [Rhizomicrobium sp.]|jgi:acyl dehydratase
MPLRSAIVGEDLPSLSIAVTPRMALAYAAVLGDETLLDDTAPDFAASPFFCVSLEWQLVIAARNAMLGVSPAEALRAVHAGQSTRFLKPLRPGQTVRVSGRIAEVRRTRAGALSVTELTVTGEDGEVVSSTLSTGIFRGVEVDGDDRRVEGAVPPASGAPVMSDMQQTVITLDRGFPHRYTECANIWNPIHTERAVALQAGLPDIIVHGTALWALAGKTLVARFAPGAPGRLKSLSGRFAAMVLPGTNITVQYGAGAGQGEVNFVVLNEKGEKAVSDGHATFSL